MLKQFAQVNNVIMHPTLLMLGSTHLPHPSYHIVVAVPTATSCVPNMLKPNGVAERHEMFAMLVRTKEKKNVVSRQLYFFFVRAFHTNVPIAKEAECIQAHLTL